MEDLEVSCIFYRLIPLSKNFKIFFLDKVDKRNRNIFKVFLFSFQRKTEYLLHLKSKPNFLKSSTRDVQIQAKGR